MADKYDGEYRSFPTTQWDMVEDAGKGSGATRQLAITRFVERYVPAMRAYLVRRKGMGRDRADDLIQSFLAEKVLDKDLIASADRSRGRFRTFLLTALDRFVISVYRYENAKKRSGGDLADIQACAEPADADRGPDNVFDVEWARQVLSEVVDRMRRECARRKRDDIWGVFEGRVLSQTIGQGQPLDYARMVQEYGLKSPAQASNVLITAKRMYIRHLRAVIGEYATDEGQIDTEIRDLRTILAKARMTD